LIAHIAARIAAHTSLDPKEVERFIKFAIVGAIGAVVDFTVLNIMKVVFENIGLGVGWDTSLDPHQIQLIAANIISFSAAVVSNFTWNRFWTFPESRQLPIACQLTQFSIVNVLGLIINTVLLIVMDHMSSVTSSTSASATIWLRHSLSVWCCSGTSASTASGPIAR